MVNKLKAKQYPLFLILAFVGGIVTDLLLIFRFFLNNTSSGSTLAIIAMGGLILTAFHTPSLDILIKGRKRRWKSFLFRWFWLPMAGCSMAGMILSQVIFADFRWQQIVFFGLVEIVSLVLMRMIADRAGPMMQECRLDHP